MPFKKITRARVQNLVVVVIVIELYETLWPGLSPNYFSSCSITTNF